MKRTKILKIFLVFAMTISLFHISNSTVDAARPSCLTFEQNTWRWSGSYNRWFLCRNRSYQRGWQFVNNHWYFLNPRFGDARHRSNLPSGAMLDGWLLSYGRWYFLNPSTGNSGHTNALPHGAMRTGWITHNSHTYFLNPSTGMADLPHGAMATRWVFHSTHGWRFLNPSSSSSSHTPGLPHGAMVANRTVRIDGQTCQFNANGTNTNGCRRQ